MYKITPRAKGAKLEMKIRILSVGKLNEPYIKEAQAEYLKRLGSYTKIEIIEVSEQKAPEKLSPAEEQQVKNKEGQHLLQKIKPGEFVFALDIQGKQVTSIAFSQKLEALALDSRSELAFVLGGSLGLSNEVLNRADLRLSLSKMTLPHQLCRIVLLEQIYRAFRISRGEPYHK